MGIELTDATRLWHVRPWEKSDGVEPIVQLYHAVYERNLSAAHYRWKLLDTPWSLSTPNIWLADTGRQLVGHYAATPLRFKLGDQNLTIGHTGDAMTHPDFRRQGVFTAVAQAAHDRWAAEGTPFMVGVPNDKWLSRRAPLGYHEQFSLNWFWRPLRPARLLSHRFRLPALLRRVAAGTDRLWNLLWEIPLGQGRAVHVSSVDRPGRDIDHLWQNLQEYYPALYVRDRAWLTYRYTDAPSVDYHILLARREEMPAGYLVYRLTCNNGRTSGWIADLFTAPADGEAQVALLRTGLAAMTTAGADTARILVSPALPLVNSLRRAGFRRASGAFDACLVALDQPLPDLSSPQAWFTMAGDYDII